jgi:hypothetical protein
MEIGLQLIRWQSIAVSNLQYHTFKATTLLLESMISKSMLAMIWLFQLQPLWLVAIESLLMRDKIPTPSIWVSSSI